LGVRLTTPSPKKILLLNFKRRPRPTQGCTADDDDKDDDDDSGIPYSIGLSVHQE
jgi:hypothetical protein